jgi:hypothetical protein
LVANFNVLAAMFERFAMNKFDFFCPQARYTGTPLPGHETFNFHFQYFANRVSLLCALQTGGKLSPSDAHRRLLHLWQEFESAIAEDRNEAVRGQSSGARRPSMIQMQFDTDDI